MGFPFPELSGERLDEPFAQVQTERVRYFLDTEFNGFGGALISLALVPEDGGQEFYAVLEHDGSIEPWVDRHVMPYLNTVPEALRSPPLPRAQASKALAAWLFREHELQSLAQHPESVAALEIVADWPEDIAQICMLLLPGPGAIVETPNLRFQLVQLPGFSTAENSDVPHNALHDARALRDHVLALE